MQHKHAVCRTDLQLSALELCVVQLLSSFLCIFRQGILNKTKTLVSCLSFVLDKKTSPDWSQLAKVCLEVLGACTESNPTYKDGRFIVFCCLHGVLARCAIAKPWVCSPNWSRSGWRQCIGCNLHSCARVSCIRSPSPLTHIMIKACGRVSASSTSIILAKFRAELAEFSLLRSSRSLTCSSTNGSISVTPNVGSCRAYASGAVAGELLGGVLMCHAALCTST